MSDNSGMNDLAASLFPSMSGDANVPNGSPGKPADPAPRAPAAKPQAPSKTPAATGSQEALKQTKELAERYDKMDSRERQIMEAAKAEAKAEAQAEAGPPREPAASTEEVSSVVSDWGMAPNEQTEALGSWAGQHGVSREAVNQLMEIRDAHMAAIEQQRSDAWYDETMATVDKFTINAAQEGLDLYGDDAFIDMLHETGAINHPAMIRFLAGIVKKGR